MATVKVTFTLDGDTIARLRATSERLAIPKSEVVREAIRDFSDRAGRLSERERRRLLEAFDRLVPGFPPPPSGRGERARGAPARARRRAAIRGAPGRPVIVLDTSLLVDALTGPRRSAPALRRAIEGGERLLLPSLVLYEWLRGPRRAEELRPRKRCSRRRAPSVLPRPRAPRSSTSRSPAAAVGRSTSRSRPAPHGGARLWTLNPRDFRDLPGLELYEAS